MDASHVQKYKNLSNVILEEIDVNRLGVPHAGEDTINYYINDNIIDYENHEIVNKLDLSEEVYVFKTCFYDVIKMCVETSNFDKAINYTKRLIGDIFGYNLLLLPVGGSMHWSLCLIVNCGHLLIPNASPPHIVFVDSIQNMHNTNELYNNIIYYLKSKKELHDVDVENIIIRQNLDSTKQINNYDCGVHLLYNTKCILEQWKLFNKDTQNTSPIFQSLNYNVANIAQYRQELSDKLRSVAAAETAAAIIRLKYLNDDSDDLIIIADGTKDISQMEMSDISGKLFFEYFKLCNFIRICFRQLK